jgi:hypothetical protein
MTTRLHCFCRERPLRRFAANSRTAAERRREFSRGCQPAGSVGPMQGSRGAATEHPALSPSPLRGFVGYFVSFSAGWRPRLNSARPYRGGERARPARMLAAEFLRHTPDQPGSSISTFTSLAVALGLWLSIPAISSAQGIARYQGGAATAFSADVFALADAMRAGGDFLVLDATARDIRARATRQDLENYKTRVNDFWEIRRKNQSERDQMRRDYLKRQDKTDATLDRIVRGNYEMGVDLSDELNYMLGKLRAAGAYSAFTGDSDRTNVLNSPENVTLKENELKQIRLREGKVAGGGMVITLDPDQLLDPHWPNALQDDRFRRLRKAFEAARDYAMSDLKSDHHIAKENQERLQKTLNDLADEFEAAWPRERRKLSGDYYDSYLPAKHCLEQLRTSVKRLIKSDHPAAYDESYRFRGKTVVDVVRHLMNHGLEFASPEAGGEGTYDTLFHSVKAFYMQLVPGEK